jgi:hypothetical protein
MVTIGERTQHHGYIHRTVNHLEFFIDPETGAHTQQIEGLWRIIKSKYNIKKNGASPRKVVEIVPKSKKPLLITFWLI